MEKKKRSTNPRPQTVLLVKMPAELKEMLRRLADKLDTTMSEFVRQELRVSIKRELVRIVADKGKER